MAKRSPPTPLPVGSMSPSVAFAAMAASTAVPPRLRTSSATWLTSGWLVAAMPCVAMTSERVGTRDPLGRGPAYDPSMTMDSATARMRPQASPRSGRLLVLLLGTRETGFENLPNFAIGHALLVTTLRVVSYDAAPERHRHGVTQVFGDFPAARKSIEDEFHGQLADAAAAPGAADEEFGHAVVDRRAAALGTAARDDGKTHRVVAAQNDEGVHRGIAEPARQLVRSAVTNFSERSRAEHAGVQRREVIQ